MADARDDKDGEVRCPVTGHICIGSHCGKNVCQMRFTATNAEHRPCTCHPDDNPPVPCPRKYALTECREAARSHVEEKPPIHRAEWDGWIRFDSDCVVNGYPVKARTAWGPFAKSKETTPSTTPQKPGSETPRMDAALGKGADWVFAQGCQLERELAARNEQLRQSCDEYRADHGGCCAASATRESALEEAAKLCEEAAGGKQRTEADRERNRTCLTLAKMIREAMNRADGGKA